MRFSTILATAAIITPAVLAASGKGHHGSSRGAHRNDDHGLNIDNLDLAEGLVKIKNIELGHQRRAEEMPGYTDGKDDAIAEPSPNAELANNGDDKTGSDAKQPSQTVPEDDNEMLDPSSMPESSGQEAGYSGVRGYIRSRALQGRQYDDDENAYGEDCGEHDEDCGPDSESYAEDEDPDSDNEKYLARIKRAREQHLKAKRAGHALKQASRREVVERSRMGRRTGSRPSASPRPAS